MSIDIIKEKLDAVKAMSRLEAERSALHWENKTGYRIEANNRAWLLSKARAIYSEDYE